MSVSPSDIPTSPTVTEGDVNMPAHPAQVTILDSPARFKINASGRRFGKTTECVFEIVKDLYRAINRGDEILCWWVAPIYTQAEIGFRKFLKIFPEHLVDGEPLVSKRIVHIHGGSRVEFKTAETPKHLEGEGVDILIIDEAPSVQRYAWEYSLSPTLADSPDSRMVAIGTPKGKNWFHELYLRGRDPDWPNYQAWSFPSAVNPFISHEYLFNQLATLPDRVWQQEHLAVFVDDQDSVFPGLRERNVLDYNWQDLDGEPPYRHGLDMARHHDWTVHLTLDANGQLVYFNRLQKRTWNHIMNEIIRGWQQYPGELRVDANRDNKIIEDLENEGVDVLPVPYGNTKKKEMIDDLAARLERKEIVIPDIPWLVNELELFQFEASRTGLVKYHAPEGHHDDTVDALMLAARPPTASSVTW